MCRPDASKYQRPAKKAQLNAGNRSLPDRDDVASLGRLSRLQLPAAHITQDPEPPFTLFEKGRAAGKGRIANSGEGDIVA